MAYIYLDELKEILPEILDQWIDGDDESWEWIFQEIEQKCHVGKRKKDKKQKKWKKKIRDDVDELQYFRHNEYEVKVNGIATKVNELSNKISHLSVNHTAMVSRVDRVEHDIKAAKSMAQTAMQRTEVDYTKCSKEAEELKNELNNMSSDDVARWCKEHIVQMCETCKYFDGKPKFNKYPCSECNHNDKWEAKDNG